MKYTRMTGPERTILAARVKENPQVSISELARGLHRDRKTVRNELGRFPSRKDYQAEKAQRMARKAARRPGERKLTEQMKNELRHRIKQGWSPEATSQWNRRNGIQDFVSKETCYRWIHGDDTMAEGLWQLLPRSHRRRHRRLPKAKDGRGRLKHRVDISLRPKRVDARVEAGHYEGDLINGADGWNVFTLVERASRFTFWDLLPNKEAGPVADAAKRVLAALPRTMRRSMTFDNGKENASLWTLAPLLSDGVFFAKPYHSWERGTNENRNGIVRRVKPKGSDFRNLTRDERARIEHMLNDRPMKCLAWRTPREVFAALLVKAAESK